ncbi:MAG: hypothetical protein ABSH35_04660 [Isosphaeraceae bacterium]
MEQTKMLFAMRKDDTYDFVPGGTMAFAMPEDRIYLTAIGTTKVTPPATKIPSDQMADWLRSLKASGYTLSARDGLGHARSINI